MRRSRAFGGWRLCNLKGLSQHARAYGYVVTHGPGNECAMPERAGEEMDEAYATLLSNASSP